MLAGRPAVSIGLPVHERLPAPLAPNPPEQLFVVRHKIVGGLAAQQHGVELLAHLQVHAPTRSMPLLAHPWQAPRAGHWGADRLTRLSPEGFMRTTAAVAASGTSSA